MCRKSSFGAVLTVHYPWYIALYFSSYTLVFLNYFFQWILVFPMFRIFFHFNLSRTVFLLPCLSIRPSFPTTHHPKPAYFLIDIPFWYPVHQ